MRQSQYEDVIYLKDGGIRRGFVVEVIPNESIKLESRYGDIFVFNLSDVDRMVKENIVNTTDVNYRAPVTRNWITQLASSVSISYTRYKMKPHSALFEGGDSNIEMPIRF